MTNLKEFKREIVKYAMFAALLALVISIPLAGLRIDFACGLLAGTAVTVLNFNLLVMAGEKVMSEGRAMPMVGGYFARLVIYGAAFVLCAKLGEMFAAIGCVTGFITIHVSILFTYLVVYGLIKKKKNPLNDWTEPKEWNDLSVYDDEDDDWTK